MNAWHTFAKGAIFRNHACIHRNFSCKSHWSNNLWGAVKRFHEHISIPSLEQSILVSLVYVSDWNVLWGMWSRDDDVIKWKHFPRYGQWRGALMFSFMCARINGWVNHREAGDLRHHRAHYDVIIIVRSIFDIIFDRSYSFVCTLHHINIIIVIVQTYLMTLNW